MFDSSLTQIPKLPLQTPEKCFGSIELDYVITAYK
jgi:hypothetical protein